MSVLSALGDNQANLPPRTVMAELPVVLQQHPGRDRAKPQRSPQQKIDDFWRRFTTESPGKATAVIPRNKAAAKAAAASASTTTTAKATTTTRSYEEAAALCRAKVARIVRECRRINQKYRDPHFDLEFDLKMNRGDCLRGLDNEKGEESGEESGGSSSDESVVSRRRRAKGRGKGRRCVPVDRGGGGGGGDDGGGAGGKESEPGRAKGRDGRGDGTFRPKSVKRVGEIFDEPTFYIDGPTANDVRQGRDGDCWLMAALCTMSNKAGLIERVCVARDEAVGVYGFVFHRDGDWISEIIDDKLYLTKPDYDEVHYERVLWEDRDRINSEELYRRTYQSNSGALYFAQCVNPNETWLPLLEKAYAKAHGDYSVIEGGFTGEGIEDLTGGVTSELFTTDILDKEYFWREELMQVNEQFLFGCSTGVWGRGWGERKGIQELHAYSVLRSVEMDGERLVLLKNPWGKGEWKGAWSDGSKEWTPEWLHKLGHRFGDDGAFWISYDDLLRKYQAFDRTRLFGPDWKVAAVWTTLSVPWTLEYHDTRFSFTLARPGPVVLVLAQLDDRYFRGLEGQYRFELSFRLHLAGEEDYLVRSQTTYRMNRSVNVELDLDPGEYHVLVKIDAARDDTVMPAEDVVRANAKDRREKLIRIGLAYDVAHGKGKVVETAEEKAAREAYEKRKREKEKKALKETIMRERRRNHYIQTKRLARNRKRMEKVRAKQKAKEEKMRAEEEKMLAARGPPSPPPPGMGMGHGHRGRARGKGKDEGRKDGKQNAQVQTDQKPDAKGARTEGKSAEEAGGEAKEDEKTEQDQQQPDPSDDHAKDADSSAQGENTPSTCSEKSSDDTMMPDSEDKEKEGGAKGGEGGREFDEAKSDPAAETSEATDHPATSLPEGETFHTASEDHPPSRRGSISSSEQGYKSDSYSDSPPPPRQGRRPGHPPPPPDHRHYPHNQPPPPPPGAFIPRRGGPMRGMPQGGGGGYMSDDSLSSLSSPSEVSDRELEIHLEDSKFAAAAAAARRQSSQPPAVVPRGRNVVDSDDEDVEKDPWNAVAVVGLRVYYRVDEAEGKESEDEAVKVRVIRPCYLSLEKEMEAEEGGKEDAEDGDEAKDVEGGMDETKVLDLDDSAKDATLGGGEKEHIVEEVKGEKEKEAEKVDDKKQDEKKQDEKKQDEKKQDEKKQDEKKQDEKKQDEKKQDEKKQDEKKQDEKKQDEKEAEKVDDEKQDEKEKDEKKQDEKQNENGQL